MAQAELFSILHSVDSTNNYAMGKVHAGMARHGMAWFAMDQTNGKGQRGKHWESQPGENILLSIVLEPTGIDTLHQFRIAVYSALAVYDFFKPLFGPDLSIKWPNDLYWRDRKAGGILIENVLHGRNWRYAVVGFGVNINQVDFGPGLANPVSLQQVQPSAYDPALLAKQFHLFFLQKYKEWGALPFQEVLKHYNKALYKKDEVVKLSKDGQLFETTIIGVSADGKLLTNGPGSQEFGFGNVEWMIG